MRKQVLAYGLIALLVAALAVGLARQELTNRRLGAELATWRRQQFETASLRAENRDLAPRQATDADRDRWESAQGEIARLQALLGEKNRRPAAKAPPPSVPASAWEKAGRQTPQTAFESVLWAAGHQEIDGLAGMLSFDDKTRTQLAAFFEKLPDDTKAQFGSPEKIDATMLAANMPTDLSATSELANATQADAATLLMQVQRNDGTQKTTYFKFQRGTDGWQLVVPMSVLRDYERELTNTSVPLAEALDRGQKP